MALFVLDKGSVPLMLMLLLSLSLWLLLSCLLFLFSERESALSFVFPTLIVRCILFVFPLFLGAVIVAVGEVEFVIVANTGDHRSVIGLVLIRDREYGTKQDAM